MEHLVPILVVLFTLAIYAGVAFFMWSVATSLARIARSFERLVSRHDLQTGRAENGPPAKPSYTADPFD